LGDGVLVVVAVGVGIVVGLNVDQRRVLAVFPPAECRLDVVDQLGGRVASASTGRECLVEVGGALGLGMLDRNWSCDRLRDRTSLRGESASKGRHTPRGALVEPPSAYPLLVFGGVSH